MSFIIISIFLFRLATLLMASNAIPPLSAPSPITATIFSSVSFSLAAVAIPRAAEMDVEL